MPQTKWDWVLLVSIFREDGPSAFAIGPFNNQPAAHDHQFEWLRQHEADFPDAQEILFDAIKIAPPQ